MTASKTKRPPTKVVPLYDSNSVSLSLSTTKIPLGGDGPFVSAEHLKQTRIFGSFFDKFIQLPKVVDTLRSLKATGLRGLGLEKCCFALVVHPANIDG